MPTEFDKAAKQLASSYRTLSTLRTKKWIGLRPEGDRVAYVKNIRGDQWKTFKKSTARLAKSYAQIEAGLREQRKKLGQQWQLNARIASVVDHDVVPPAQHAEWSTRKTELGAELRKRGLSSAKVKKALSRIAAIRGSTIVNNHQRTLLRYAGQLDHFAELSLAGSAGTTLAQCVTQFNAAFKNSSGVLPGAKAFVLSTDKKIITAERKYYEQLKTGRFPVPDPEREVIKLLNQAIHHAAAVAKARKTKPADAALGTLAIDLGNLLRQLLRHLALRNILKWISTDEATSPTKQEWSHAAASLKFESAIKAPRQVTIATLVKKPKSIAAGTRISVRGLVGPIKILHAGNKVISSASLSDASKHAISIVAHHRKLDSAGMVGGSYAAVVGEWTPAKSGGSLLLVRHRYLELASSSWTDWVTNKLRPIYEASPQGLATEWSWQPGKDGAGNQLRYGLWFSGTRQIVK